MTQRVELATVMDRLAVDELVTHYAVAVDDGDWAAYRGLFTPDGRADYRSAGGIEGHAEDLTAWLADSMLLFPMRQHLLVNRRVRLGTLDQDVGDTARVQADYVNPMRFAADAAASSAPDFVCGGRYRSACRAPATAGGWRLAAARGGRTGEVAAPARADRRAREEPLNPGMLAEITENTHTGANGG